MKSKITRNLIFATITTIIASIILRFAFSEPFDIKRVIIFFVLVFVINGLFMILKKKA